MMPLPGLSPELSGQNVTAFCLQQGFIAKIPWQIYALLGGLVVLMVFLAIMYWRMMKKLGIVGSMELEEEPKVEIGSTSLEEKKDG